jgi:methyl-accepting chemotaxis protein
MRQVKQTLALTSLILPRRGQISPQMRTVRADIENRRDNREFFGGGAQMAEMSIETILSKVRENREELEKTSAELDAARSAVEHLGADLLQAREELDSSLKLIAERDEAVEDLLKQNQELAESLANCQAECEAMRAASTEKDKLVDELSTLLA